MALTEDQAFLYIGLLGSPEVVKFNLEKSTIDGKFNLGSDASFGPNLAEDILVLPGSNSSVLVSLMNTAISPRHRGVRIYDNGIMRPKMTQEHTGSNVLTSTRYNGKIYGYNNETTEFGFRHLIVSDSGLVEGYVYEAIINGFGTVIESRDSFIYSSAGEVLDLSKDIPLLVGKFDLTPGYQTVVEPAIDSSVVYFVIQNFQNEYYLQSFDPKSFGPKGDRLLPNSVSGILDNLLQWGGKGKLALNTSENIVILRDCISEINETPTLASDLKGGCFGDTLILEATSGLSNYYWSNGYMGPISKVYEEGDYYYTIADEEGCQGPPSNAIHMHFEFIPSAPYVYSETDFEICHGETVKLLVGSGQVSQYLWSTGDTTSSIEVSTAGPYSVIGFTPYGCASPTSEAIEIVALPDSVPPMPTINVQDTMVCQGNPVSLKAPEGYLIYQWTTGEQSAAIEVFQTGMYAVQVGNIAACLSQFSAFAQIDIVESLQQPNIQANGNLLASSSPFGNQWFVNGTIIPGATEQFYEALTTGFYSVQILLDGCESPMSDLYNLLTTATEDLNQERVIQIYPNPTRDLLSIKQSLYVDPIVEIFELTGKKIMTKRLTEEVDLTELSAGVYLLKISNADHTNTVSQLISKL